MSEKPLILIFTDWFDPAYKAGGPVRSLVNFVIAMSKDYRIKIFTSDRDTDDKEPFSDKVLNQWESYNEMAQVYYASPSRTWHKINKVLAEEEHVDYVYLNSMYSIKFMLLPLLSILLRKKSANLVLNPRGMLKASALSHKWIRKKIFLMVFQLFRLEKKVNWQFTDEGELNNARKIFNKELNSCVIPNFPVALNKKPITIKKNPGELRMIFLGRIHPIKNLDIALNVLNDIDGQIKFSIYGPIEDLDYWLKCKSIITSLPQNITVEYSGPVRYELTNSVLSQNHMLFSPTQGENFGHNIYEALACARPVLISDQTPWRNLDELGVGWDIPLESKESFASKIVYMVSLDQPEFDQISQASWQYAANYQKKAGIYEKYIKLFSN